MKLLSPDARAERRLAICLALIAGYVDAYGLIALGVYVSFYGAARVKPCCRFFCDRVSSPGLMTNRDRPEPA